MFFSMIFSARCDMVMLQRGSSDRDDPKGADSNSAIDPGSGSLLLW